MAIRVQCQSCQAQFSARDEMAGRSGKCPKCRAPIQVPASNPAVPTRRPQKQVATSNGEAPAAPITRDVVAAQPRARTTDGAAAAPRPARPGNRAALAEQVLAGFRGDIRRVRAGIFYRAGIVLTAGMMVLLPLVYLGLIGLAGYAVYYHAVHNAWIAQVGVGRARLFAVSAYAAPIVAGVILVFFMLKPLIARPVAMGRTRSLTRQGEPVLFSLVDRICQAVGARRPVRIEVDADLNASASLDAGMLKLVRNRLVLRIGVPLAAGMTATELAGVLAHEFGHFTQGAGMRFWFLISSINRWFARVVYSRDAWDAWLEETADEVDFRIGWMLQLSRLAVFVSRGILWVFMMVGHVVSSFMSRQMEYHADVCHARLVGGAAFEETHRKLGHLSLAYQRALEEMQGFVDRGSFADDLPEVMLTNGAAAGPAIWHAVDRQFVSEKSGWFDLYPTTRDRIRRAAREGQHGVFADDRPAAELFSDFKALSRGVTWDLYRACFGSRFQPSMMRPTDELLRGEEPATARANEPVREIELE